MWEKVQFPAKDVGEPVIMIGAAVAQGYKLEIIQPGFDFVYIRHDKNTWKFDRDRVLRPVPCPRELEGVAAWLASF